MKLEDFEYRVGKSRYYEIKIKCAECGNDFWVRWSRYKDSTNNGRFCSKACYNKYQSTGRKDKEHATICLDKKRNAYYAFWTENEKYTSTTYAKWWWETHNGPIPKGYRASYKDGNPLNIADDNICLISPQEFGNAVSKRLMGHTFSDETLEKMSKIKRGKPLSDSHRRNIGKSMVGDKNRFWRGGVATQLYPVEFDKVLKEKVAKRDGYVCRICGKSAIGKNGPTHHIDADKSNNKMENLILLCTTCHRKIHTCKHSKDPVILAFQSRLEY